MQAPTMDQVPVNEPVAEADRHPPMGLFESLLRDPKRFAELCDEGDAASIAKVLLATIAIAGACFGVTLGLFHGGVQVAYAALKVPAVLLATLVLAVPAFLAIARVFGVAATARNVVLLSLGASARFSLVVAGLAPVLWIAEGWVGYHRMVLATVVACALGGVMAAGLLFRGLGVASRASRSAIELAAVAFIAVYAIVGAQTSWLLRPFLVRPKTTQVPFVRPIESDLLDAIGQSSKSAAGIYDSVRAVKARSRDCGGDACD